MECVKVYLEPALCTAAHRLGELTRALQNLYRATVTGSATVFYVKGLICCNAFRQENKSNIKAL